MKVEIVDPQTFDETAAQQAISQIEVKSNSRIGFATGNTTVGLHHVLADTINNQKVCIDKIAVYNLDEYVGLSQENPLSCFYRMKNQLYNRIGLSPQQINFLDGDTLDPSAECQRFEESIRNSGGIDLQFVGIGLNGHIGFNEPHTPFESTTHVINIDLTSRTSRVSDFGSLEKVPAQGITMGIKTIMMCRKIVLLAKGKHKAEIVKKALLGPVTTEVPASILQLHPNITVILDQEAAELL
ncbi:glucosamine-6-phosphate deaminase [Fredinandcohnia sp. 179-A 10B2 NHS]|uniref:glucosamine-6-phosphate deaminase n=1 Tax=Fredinandcohnia sp. 179-A 10B2 NHS TaxID=3235176 RepID=UPI0039A29E38